jgi:hypothetical protein
VPSSCQQTCAHARLEPPDDVRTKFSTAKRVNRM